MTNAGAVTVTGIQGQAVSATAATNDQYLKYSASSSEWQKVDVLAPDRLTTKVTCLFTIRLTLKPDSLLELMTTHYLLTRQPLMA